MTTTTCKRFGKRWTINECIQLQREFELLQLSIDEIAQRHQRTPYGIMMKIDQEGFADYNTLYHNYSNLKSTEIQSRTRETRSTATKSSGTNVQPKLLQIKNPDELSDIRESDSESESYDTNDLKQHVMRIDKKLNDIIQIMLNQGKNNSTFSLF